MDSERDHPGIIRRRRGRFKGEEKTEKITKSKDGEKTINKNGKKDTWRQFSLPYLWVGIGQRL